MRMSGHITGVTLSANTTADPAAAFVPGRPLTLGLEEELLLLDAETLDLAPRAADVLARLPEDGRFKPELPAAQLEIAAPPTATVGEGAAALAAARAELAAACDALGLRPAGVGVHPFAAGLGVVSEGARYRALMAEHGAGIMRRQLVSGLHVHVAVGGPDRALAVYNALREELPALAALAAGSPFYEGADSGLASVRPKICGLLPRQGVPPVLPDWAAFAAALRGRPFAEAQWWWELRPHAVLGTLEVRVMDTQPTVRASAALAALVHALVATLCDMYDNGGLPEPAPSWRIAENRWSACRHGVEGPWTDVRTGAVAPTAEHVDELMGLVAPAARRLGCADELAGARELLEHPAAAAARAAGPRGHAESLVAAFT
jgi:glutamate---cysteine ligase / carboxylate-amine ligase